MNIAEENQFIKRKNALTDSMQQNSPDINKMLVDVMKNEYPDNPVYLAGNTYTGQNQPLVSPTGVEIRNTNQPDLSTRNELNYVKINSRKNQKTKYKLTKMLPTINGDDLDDYLDDEWVYYLNPRYNLLPRTDGLFIINREINLNPPDFHH